VGARQALIIFVKNSTPGSVKTRLASVVGDTAALEIYQQLLVRTRSVIQGIRADLFVYYSDYIPAEDIWQDYHYQKRVQQDGDLGNRMHQAIVEVLETHGEVILIGSDTADLGKDMILDAFSSLAYVDIVIGPATDGGYYLIGMKQQHPELFQDMQWSHDAVYNETRNSMVAMRVNFKVLPARTDIDEFKDLIATGWPIPG